MPYPQFDRQKLNIKPLGLRKNRVFIERDLVPVTAEPENLTPEASEAVGEASEKIKTARRNGASVILAFGAHTIKNGLAPVLIRLLEEGWVTHLATNGAGIIHDWELSFQGATSEDVRENVKRGEFGLWEETGYFLNLSINIGSFEGLGYGESVGALVQNEGLRVPDKKELIALIGENAERDPEKSARAADLLEAIDLFNLVPGYLEVRHPHREYGVQAAGFRLNIPYTGHPMFGHDIIYPHPMSRGASIGRTAERDFLAFAHSVSNLEGGVYLSIGSAVMSPMIFEKSFSMAQNLALRKGRHIDNHSLFVVDLATVDWNWETCGEPPPNNPAYYLRFCKTFSRMGGRMRYTTANNRDFLLALCKELSGV